MWRGATPAVLVCAACWSDGGWGHFPAADQRQTRCARLSPACLLLPPDTLSRAGLAASMAPVPLVPVATMAGLRASELHSVTSHGRKQRAGRARFLSSISIASASITNGFSPMLQSQQLWLPQQSLRLPRDPSSSVSPHLLSRLPPCLISLDSLSHPASASLLHLPCCASSSALFLLG